MSTGPYDIVIIGSGITGLYLAVELAKNKRRVVVIEKEKDLGGRAFTFKQKFEGIDIQWEAGAGRISERHKHVRELMKRYKLTWAPIGGETAYIETYGSKEEPNVFETGIPIFIDTIAGLPAADLATNTIRELLTKIHGSAKAEEYLIHFTYRAEMDTMRADMALRLFVHEFRDKENYGICVEGISAIIDGLRGEFEAKGGTILREHSCVSVAQEGKRGPVKIVCMKSGEIEPVVMEGKRCILAVPVAALEHIKPFETWRPAKHLKMMPLLRFYGIFPKGDPWATKRIATATRIRYMIPGNPAIGSVQMSYTDSQDADFWKKRLDEVGEKAVGEEILGDLRRLIRPDIPPPTFVRAHYWEHGATYWLPGSYDPVEESRAAYRPLANMPAVHLCGESFSVHQGWMEGGLDHAVGLLRILDV
jgi:monoamine oxidase